MFTKAIQLNPDNTDAWISLGSVTTKTGKKAIAEQAFKRAAGLPKTKAPLAYVVFLIRQDRRPQGFFLSRCLRPIRMTGWCAAPWWRVPLGQPPA